MPSSANVSATPGTSSTSWSTRAAASSVIARAPRPSVGRALVAAARSSRAGCAGSWRCRSRARRRWPAPRRPAPRGSPCGRAWGGRASRGSRRRPARTGRCSPTGCRRRRRRGSAVDGHDGESRKRRPAHAPEIGPAPRRKCRCLRVASAAWTPPSASPIWSTSTTRGSGRPSAATAGPCRPSWATRRARRSSTRSGCPASTIPSSSCSPRRRPPRPRCSTTSGELRAGRSLARRGPARPRCAVAPSGSC